MTLLRFVQIIALAALTAGIQQACPQQTSPQAQPAPPASCPVTRRPDKMFVPPAPYQTELSNGCFWLGTEKLWTELCENQVWEWTPHRPGHEQDLTAKIFWARVGYSYRTEPVPKLEVTGRRI